jgi:hypothetical protein
MAGSSRLGIGVPVSGVFGPRAPPGRIKAMRTTALLALCCALASPALAAPVVTFSVTQIYHGEYVHISGTGFTPNGQVTSHLMRPDGTEYPEIPMKANAQGVVTHDLTIVPATFGTYELQLEDRATNTVATRRFLMVPAGFDKPVRSTAERMPASFDGVWDGTMTQKGSTTATRMLVGLSGGRIGAVVGTVAYPALRCGGELWLVSTGTDTMQVGEVILYGQDRCNNRALITVGRDASGAMTMLWKDVTGAGSAAGSLKKRSECPRYRLVFVFS